MEVQLGGPSPQLYSFEGGGHPIVQQIVVHQLMYNRGGDPPIEGPSPQLYSFEGGGPPPIVHFVYV